MDDFSEHVFAYHFRKAVSIALIESEAVSPRTKVRAYRDYCRWFSPAFMGVTNG